MGARGPLGDKEIDHAIGVRVYRERQRRGLTLQVLARRSGLHVNTLNNVENGRGISVSSLCRVAIAMHLTLDELVPLSQHVVVTSEDAHPLQGKLL